MWADLWMEKKTPCEIDYFTALWHQQPTVILIVRSTNVESVQVLLYVLCVFCPDRKVTGI